MMIVSGIIAVVGIMLAWYFHLANRALTDRLAVKFSGLTRAIENQWYYDATMTKVFRDGLWNFGHFAHVVDVSVLHRIALIIGFIPKAMAYAVRPFQRGLLQGYGLSMVAGMAIIVLLIAMKLMRGE